MSHNLTDRELNDLIAAAVAVTERMSPEERAAMMEAQRQSWARGEAGLRETSASPPRVPVSSAHDHTVGVESGPGQPMADICERLDAEAMRLEHKGCLVDEFPSALMRKAAAEIRRLRAAGDARYRAGIEAAAKMFDRQAEEMEKEQANPGLDLPPPTQDILTVRGRAAAIRALADAPAKKGING